MANSESNVIVNDIAMSSDEQSAASSEEMSSQAHILLELVERFKLKG